MISLKDYTESNEFLKASTTGWKTQNLDDLSNILAILLSRRNCSSQVDVVLNRSAQNWDRLRVPRHPDWSAAFLIRSSF